MSKQRVQGDVNRRMFLGLTGLGALAVSGCSFDGSSGGGGGGDDAIEITAATYMPPSYTDVYPSFEIFMDAARSESNGEVSFDWHGSGTLLAADEIMTGLTQSVADMVFSVSSYNASTYPILGSYALPFVVDGVDQLTRAVDPTGDLYPILNEQLGEANLHMLGSVATVPQWLWTVDKPVRTPADLKGLRIRTAGEIEGSTIAALGGAPVAISSAELFEALKRGTIDGVMSYPGTIPSRDLQQVLGYGTMAAFSAYSMDSYVRSNWLSNLSEDNRGALEAAGRTYHNEGSAHGLKVHKDEYMPLIEESVELIELSKAQIQEFRSASDSVIDKWKGEIKDEGVAASALEAIRSA